VLMFLRGESAPWLKPVGFPTCLLYKLMDSYKLTPLKKKSQIVSDLGQDHFQLLDNLAQWALFPSRKFRKISES
jgi:hypothetical protein